MTALSPSAWTTLKLFGGIFGVLLSDRLPD